MRLVVHDYSGHPFQVQLSRELARRGHHVLHLHCPGYQSGKGALSATSADPATFEVAAVDMGGPFEKYSPLRRVRQERQYARALAREIRRFGPQVIISSNNPLLAQRMLSSWCERQSLPLVFWQQDIYSVALDRAFRRRVPLVGPFFGRWCISVEKKILRQSSAVVCISPDFVEVLRSWGLDQRKVHVIENWAPLRELSAAESTPSWQEQHGFRGKRLITYAGTLGLKHDPGLLLELATALEEDKDISVVVLSEGRSAEWLRLESRRLGLRNLSVMGFVPYTELPAALASATLLLVILEEDAGLFSVPSKVLTYHCIGRPILASMPKENLAARLIERVGSGVVVEPGERANFIEAARRLLADSGGREEMGRRGRSYAEMAFDIEAVGTRFEDIIAQAVSANSGVAEPRDNGVKHDVRGDHG